MLGRYDSEKAPELRRRRSLRHQALMPAGTRHDAPLTQRAPTGHQDASKIFTTPLGDGTLQIPFVLVRTDHGGHAPCPRLPGMTRWFSAETEQAPRTAGTTHRVFIRQLFAKKPQSRDGVAERTTAGPGSIP
jgi:hypothetical protein